MAAPTNNSNNPRLSLVHGTAPDDPSLYSDIWLKADDLDASVVFPGPLHIPEQGLGDARQLLERCKAFTKPDFMVSLQGQFWRGRRDDQVVDGIWFHLRGMPPTPPTLDTLPSPMPAAIRSMLMAPMLGAGGLVYIVGAPGSGKTTSGSATLVSRLKQYGGVARTIENPPEMPLNGWHGAGFCTQSWVAGDGAADWAESFRGVLRSQPARTPVMLYVGEVRDQESAAALLRAASSGFLVIATGFGTDIVSGLDALVRLAGRDTLDGFAAMLRLVVHQSIFEGTLLSTALAFTGPACPASMRVRSGALTHLQNDIQFQANQMRLGRSPLDPQ